jgi:hypothetical protein
MYIGQFLVGLLICSGWMPLVPDAAQEDIEELF